MSGGEIFREILRTIAVVAIALAFLAVAGLVSVYGSDESASVMWGASLVLLAGLTAIHTVDQRRRSLRILAQNVAIAIVFFGGLWFISRLTSGRPLDGFVWPLAAVAAVLIVTTNIERIGSAFRQTRIVIRKVSFQGIEIELDRGVVDRVERELTSSIRALFDSIDREYRRAVRVRNVDRLLAEVYGGLPALIFPQTSAKQVELANDNTLRSAVHVPDVVFNEFTYQLTDYVPHGAPGSGRRFSQRRGIVGLSWRLKESAGQGDVFSGASDADKPKKLQEQWGMFEQETKRALERPSCMTVLLKSEDGSRNVGLLYLDSTRLNAFGDDSASRDAALRLEADPKVRALGKAVAEIDNVMRELALNFDLAKLTE